MTRKLFHSMTVLALAFCAGQCQLLLAQSAPAASGIALHPTLARHYQLLAFLKAHATARPSGSSADADASPLKKAKVYQFRTVDYPAATASEVYDFNDATAVGYFRLGSNPNTAFSFKGTTNHVLNINGAVSSTIYGINASGQMVGSYEDSAGDTHGFLDSAGTITTLDYPAASQTEAMGINAGGEIVGTYRDTSLVNHGFLYKNSTFTSIDDPNANQGGLLGTFVSGINLSGEIVGYYTSNNHPLIRGFVLSNGVYSTIEYPGVDDTFVYGINDAGSVAGSFFDSSFASHGFTYIGGAFNQVDVLGGTTNTNIYHIENSGYVVGSAQDSLGEYHGILGH